MGRSRFMAAARATMPRVQRVDVDVDVDGREGRSCHDGISSVFLQVAAPSGGICEVPSGPLWCLHSLSLVSKVVHVSL